MVQMWPEKPYVHLHDKWGNSVGSTRDWQIVPGAYDYIIFREGSYEKGKNCRTGQIDIKSDDLSEVLSEALANSQGRIHILAGEHDAYTPVDIPTADSAGYATNFGWIIEGDSSYDARTRGTIINLHGQSYWWKFKESSGGYGYYTQTMFRNLSFKGTGAEDVITYDTPTNGGNYAEAIFENMRFENINRAIRYDGYRYVAKNLQARNITTQAFYFMSSSGAVSKLNLVSAISQTNSSEYAIYIHGSGVVARHLDAENAQNGINLEGYNIYAISPYAESITNIALRVRALGAVIVHPDVSSGKVLLGDSDADSANLKLIIGCKQTFSPSEVTITKALDVLIDFGFYGPDLYGLINNVSGSYLRFRGRGLQNSGTATFSGDGSTTTFTIAHGLVATPSKYFVQPLSADAMSTPYDVSVDGTNITITFKSAPASGANLKFYWYAEVG